MKPSELQSPPARRGKPSEFPGARGFFEVPDESLFGAFPVIVDAVGNAWAFDRGSFELPRPIYPEEIESRGGFRCKFEDADDLLPDGVIMPNPGS